MIDYCALLGSHALLCSLRFTLTELLEKGLLLHAEFRLVQSPLLIVEWCFISDFLSQDRHRLRQVVLL